MDMNQLVETAQEVVSRAHNRVTTIAFKDGSVTTVTGSWEVRKPVWCIFEDKPKLEEAIFALIQAYEKPSGEPAYPEKYSVWKKENPKLAKKVEKAY